MIEIKNLNKTFKTEVGTVEALKNINFTVEDGEIYGIIGMSGAGKSTLVRCINMIEKPTSGEVRIDDVDLTKLQDWQLRKIRRDVTMIFQSFNLLMQKNVRDNIELPLKFAGVNKKKSRKAVNELLELVGLEDKASAFPAQLSGGQRQRVAIAIALACDPALIIADEPTTALDPRNQNQIISVLKRLAAERNKGILFITHDLGLARELATKIAVMKDGKFVETAEAEDIFENPKHEYTKALVRYSQYGKMGSHYHGNFGQTIADRDGIITSSETIDQVEAAPKIMIAKDIYMIYRTKKHGYKKVLSGYSLDVVKGEILGLVGQSGCGKSTLARIIMGITTPNGGSVEWGRCGSRDRREVRTQMIFQDSASAFNPRMTIEEIIAEPLVIARVGNREERRRKVMEVMKQVHLEEQLMDRYPYDVSGGQRQRAAIARALITEPEFIIADEPLSSLDVPTQAEIVHLLRDLHEKRQLTMILISHDIPMVEHVCDRIVSMDE